MCCFSHLLEGSHATMAPCLSDDEIATAVKDQPDFLAGVRAWVVAVGEPMSWPEWQSGIAQVRLYFPETAFDEKAPGYAKEVSELREAEMLRAFGPAYEDDPHAPLLPSARLPPVPPAPWMHGRASLCRRSWSCACC